MTNQLAVSEVALPAGYTMRPVTMDDLAATVELLNKCSVHDFGREEFSLEDMQTEWTVPEFDLGTSTQAIFTPEGQLVAYVEVLDYRPNPVHPWIWGRVHPDYKGRGLGTYMHRWADERAHLAIAKCTPEARVSTYARAIMGDKATEGIFTSYGMTPIRHSWFMRIEMTEEPEVPAMPEGLSIRQYQHPQDVEAAYQADVDAFRDHWGFYEPSYEFGLAQFTHFVENEIKPQLSFFAIDDATGEVAGLCLSFILPDGTTGWVDTLGIRRPWRKRGVGLALLRHNFHNFWQQGITEVELSVDASSLTGATRLYERAGMHVSRQMTLYGKELRPGIELGTTTVE